MSEEFAEGDVCMPNIGPGERAKRRRIGVVFSVVTAGVAVALIGLHAPRITRVAVFVPALVAAYGFAQARAKT
jgi:hypothetical protein